MFLLSIVTNRFDSAHIEEYGKTVQDRVKGEVGGAYRDLILTILNTAWPDPVEE